MANQGGHQGWIFDLDSDPTADPFVRYRARRRLIGQCAECGRAFEWDDKPGDSFFLRGLGSGRVASRVT